MTDEEPKTHHLERAQSYAKTEAIKAYKAFRADWSTR